MAQISDGNNSTNHKIHSYDQTRKMIINLGSWKVKNNKNSSPQLTRLHNSLLMRIFDTPEKDLSNVEGK